MHIFLKTIKVNKNKYLKLFFFNLNSGFKPETSFPMSYDKKVDFKRQNTIDWLYQ